MKVLIFLLVTMIASFVSVPLLSLAQAQQQTLPPAPSPVQQPASGGAAQPCPFTQPNCMLALQGSQQQPTQLTRLYQPPSYNITKTYNVTVTPPAIRIPIPYQQQLQQQQQVVPQQAPIIAAQAPTPAPIIQQTLNNTAIQLLLKSQLAMQAQINNLGNKVASLKTTTTTTTTNATKLPPPPPKPQNTTSGTPPAPPNPTCPSGGGSSSGGSSCSGGGGGGPGGGGGGMMYGGGPGGGGMYGGGGGSYGRHGGGGYHGYSYHGFHGYGSRHSGSGGHHSSFNGGPPSMNGKSYDPNYKDDGPHGNCHSKCWHRTNSGGNKS